MKHITFLLRYLVVLLFAFLAGRILFIYHNDFVDPQSLSDYLICFVYGFPLDLKMALIMLAIPSFILFIQSIKSRFPVKVCLRLYLVISGLLAGASVVADTLMYGPWRFKLDNCIWGYIDMNKASSSLTPAQQALTISTVVGTLLAFQLPVLLVPFRKVLCASQPKRFLLFISLAIVYICLPIRIGTCYWSEHLLLNHATTNSSYNLAASFIHDCLPFTSQFNYLPDDEYKKIGGQLYPTTSDNTPMDTLLNTQRPNILFIQLESCGATFVGALGGDSTATPCLNQLAKEGIMFTHCYSNSFRTDRATVSALSGELSFPTISLMLRDKVLPKLPSLARALAENGYDTHYQYGGLIEGMNKGKYIRQTGYNKITYEVDYDIPDELDSSWGANDSITFERLVSLVDQHQQSNNPWFITHQTISSHEPWIVPYHALDNPILNAFAYTDHHLGKFIKTIQKTKAWDNLLIVVYSDHGFLYNQTLEDPEYFHIPMLWLGGAVKQSCVVDQFMNESDLPATVLAQVGISAQQFPFSRNVLSKAYQQYSFAFSTYPAGFMYADNTGATMYDIHAGKEITRQHHLPGVEERIKKGQAILQYSYDYLNKLMN